MWLDFDVPVVQLVVPFKMAREIWNCSDPAAVRAGPSRPEPPAMILNWWWGLFVVSALLGETSINTVFNGDPGQVFLTKFVLRGKAITKGSALDVAFEDASSQAVFGIQEATVENRLF